MENKEMITKKGYATDVEIFTEGASIKDIMELVSKNAKLSQIAKGSKYSVNDSILNTLITKIQELIGDRYFVEKNPFNADNVGIKQIWVTDKKTEIKITLTFNIKFKVVIKRAYGTEYELKDIEAMECEDYELTLVDLMKKLRQQEMEKNKIEAEKFEGSKDNLLKELNKYIQDIEQENIVDLTLSGFRYGLKHLVREYNESLRAKKAIQED